MGEPNGPNLTFTSATIAHSNMSSTSYTLNVTEALNPVDGSDGNLCDSTDGCNLSVKLPNNIPGGNYTLSTAATWNGTGSYINLSGTLSNNSFIVNGTGINITRMYDGTTVTLVDANSTLFNVSVTNYGMQTATGKLSFSYQNYTDPVYADIKTFNATDSTCYTNLNATVSNFTVNLTASKTCWYQWIIIGTNVSTNWTESSLMIRYANPSSNFSNSDGVPFNNITSISLTVNNFVIAEGSTTSSSSSSSSGSGGGGSGATCTSDSDCSSGYYCTSSSCAALSCTADQYAGTHACIDYNYTMKLEPEHSVVYVTLGESNSSKVILTNNGNIAFKAMLSADAGEGVTTSASPTETVTLGIGDLTTVTVTYNTTAATPIGNHTTTLKAYKSGNEAKSSTTTITLVVIPTEEKKALIASNQSNFTSFIPGLEAAYSSIKSGLSAEKQAEIEATIASLKSKLSEADAALQSGDYIAADELHRQILEEIDDLSTRLESAEAEAVASSGQFWGNATIWTIAIIVAAAIAAFVIYLLLPPKKGQPKMKPVKPKPTGKGKFKFPNPFKKKDKAAPWVASRPKELYKPAPQQKPGYQQGYQRASAFSYDTKQAKAGNGLGTKLKSIFKKKPKKQANLYTYAGK